MGVESIKSNLGIELVIFEKIRLIVGEGREAGQYHSRVEDLINGGVVISEPEFVSGHTLLRNGIVVCVQITRRDAAYQFYSRIHTQKSSGLKQVILTPPKRLERVQRRMFARVDLASRITYGELSDGLDWSDWEQQVTWHKTWSANISGGGTLIRLPGLMKQDQLVAMQIEIFRKTNLPKYVVAVCRRAFKSEDLFYGGFEYLLADDLRFHFKGAVLSQLPEALQLFSNHTQDKLVAMLFSIQIEQRQKGAL